MASNIFQQRITPVKPKVLEGQQIFVYVEEAGSYDENTTDTSIKRGIAAFLKDHFNIDKGKVKLNTKYLSEAPFDRASLIKLNELDFVKNEDEEDTKVNWPLAYNNKGIYNESETNANGFGLMKIAEKSAGWLKYDGNGNTQVDTSKVNTAITTITDPLDSRLTTVENNIEALQTDFTKIETHFNKIETEFIDLRTLVNTFDNRIIINTENIETNSKNITTNTNNITKLSDKVNNIIQVNDEQNDQIYDLQTRTKGLGGYLNTYNFGAEVTQDDLTNYAMEQISVTDKTQIFNGTKVINSYDSHLWVLTNTPTSSPAVFEWEDLGVSQEISVATTSLLGLVKSSTKNLEGNINTNTGVITINNLSTKLSDLNLVDISLQTQINTAQKSIISNTTNIATLTSELSKTNSTLATAQGDIKNLEDDLLNYYTKEEINNLLPVEEDWTRGE